MAKEDILRRIAQDIEKRKQKRTTAFTAPIITGEQPQPEMPDWMQQPFVPSISGETRLPPQGMLPQPVVSPVGETQPIVPEREYAWWEKPAELAESATKGIGGAIAKTPVLPGFLKSAPVSGALKGLQWLDEAWAATLASVAVPEIREAGSLPERMEAYRKWQAPTYIKGVLEVSNPIDLALFIGLAFKGAKAISKAGVNIAEEATQKIGIRAVSAIGDVADDALISRLATEGIGGIPIGEAIGEFMPKTGKAMVLPNLAEWQAGIPESLARRTMQKAYDVPVVKNFIEAVNGKAAWFKRNPVSKVDQAINANGFSRYIQSQVTEAFNVKMNSVYAKWKDNILQLDANGLSQVVEPLSDKLGREYLDVIRYPSQYKWLDNTAKEFVGEIHNTVRFMQDTFVANGGKLPEHVPDLLPEFFEYYPKIVKGIKAPDGGLIKALETNPFLQETFETMKEGMAQGYVYTGDVLEGLDLLKKSLARKLGDIKLQEGLSKLGYTEKTLWGAFAEPTFIKAYSDGLDKVRVLGKLKDRLKFLRPGAGNVIGKPIGKEILDQLRVNGFNDVAEKIASAQKLTSTQVIRYLNINKFKLRREFQKTFTEILPEHFDIDEFADIVSRFSTLTPEGVYQLAEDGWGRAINQLKTTKAGIQSAIKEIDDVIGQNANSFKVLQKQQSAYRKMAENFGVQTVKFGERLTSIRSPLFNGKLYEESAAKVVNSILEEKGSKTLGALSTVSGVSRTLTATLDASVLTLSLLPAFGRNPAIVLRTVKEAIGGLISPEKGLRELVSRTDSLLDYVAHGGVGVSSEWFESMPLLQRGMGYVGGKIGGETGREIGERAVREVFGRAQSLYAVASTVARDELWKAHKAGILAKGLGEEATEIALRDVARSIDRMTGVMNPDHLLLNATQKQAESAFLMFAPRYTRAALSLVGDMFKGGVTGSEARKAIAGTALSGITLYHATCKLLGQQENYDVNSGRFMTVEINGRHVGVGGIYTSLLRLMGDTVEAVSEQGVQAFAPTREEGQGRLSPLNFNRRDQPFYEFLMNRSAPLTGTLLGIIEQSDYLGEPFENFGDFAQFLAEKGIPLSFQPLLENRPWEPPQTIGTKATILGTNILGLREFPKSAWELRDEARNNLSMSAYGKTWDDLNRAEQKNLEMRDPVIANLSFEIDKIEGRIATPERRLFNAWREEMDMVKQERDSFIGMAAQKAEQTGDYLWFRKIIAEFDQNYAAQITHIYNTKAYQEIMQNLNESVKDLTKADKMDLAYDVYAGVLYGNRPVETYLNTVKAFNGTAQSFGEMENEFGEPNWDNIDAFKEWYIRVFGEEAYNYASQERPLAGRELPPLYLELRQAKETLKPYWGIKDEYLKKFPYLSERKLNRIVTRERERMRKYNQAISQAYDKFYKNSA